MKAEDLITLNEQLSAMARAGLPLDEGLKSLVQDMQRGKLRNATEKLASDLQAGHTLPESIARQAEIPKYYSSLMMSGIHTGQLGQVLTTLTHYARSIAQTRTIIWEALFYPFVVLIIGVTLLGFLAIFVLPEFATFFQEMGMQLPGVTKLAIEFSRNYEYTLILPIVVMTSLFIALWILPKWSGKGGRIANRIVCNIPVFGTLIHAARMQAITELLEILVRYKTPLPAAFQMAGLSSVDGVIQERCRKVAESLETGASLGQCLKDTQLLPRWLSWVATAGSEKSELPEAFHEIAEFYQRRVKSLSLVLRSILPPIIVLMTATILMLIFSGVLLLPFIKMLEGLSK